MILTCQQCQTNYMVKPEFMGPTGRQVKCVKCGHVWRHVPEGATATGEPAIQPVPENIQPIPKGGALPVVQKSGVSFGLKLLPICLLLLTFGISALLYQDYATRYFPQLAMAYDVFGLHSTQGLALKSFSLQPDKTDKHRRLIHGTLVNNAKEERILPSMKITLSDKNRQEVASYMLKSTGAIISPGETLNFSNPLPNLDSRIAYVSVDIGNQAELLLRNIVKY